jgi:hypothetical protein
MKRTARETSRLQPEGPPQANRATTAPTMQPRAARLAPTITTDALGTQTLEGFLVDGTRITRTIPAGAEGNDRPLVIVTERWISSELHLPLLTKITSPVSGVQTIRISHIDRSEPDPSLFEVPPDYTIAQQ